MNFIQLTHYLRDEQAIASLMSGMFPGAELEDICIYVSGALTPHTALQFGVVDESESELTSLNINGTEYREVDTIDAFFMTMQHYLRIGFDSASDELIATTILGEFSSE